MSIDQPLFRKDAPPESTWNLCAIGISAAQALVDRVLAGGPQAAADYLMFLEAGSSQYPLDLFSLAGVDMATPAPIEKAFSALSDIVSRLENLIE